MKYILVMKVITVTAVVALFGKKGCMQTLHCCYQKMVEMF